MGVNSSKDAYNALAFGRGEMVDYGSLIPQGIYSEANLDYDHKAVRKFIREGRLAPFYKGLNDPSERPPPVEDEHDPTDNNSNSSISRLLSYRPILGRRKSSETKDQLLYSRIVECPICFMLKRSYESPLTPPVCPFCVQPNFGVLHIPPRWSPHYEAFCRRRSDLISPSDDAESTERRRSWHLASNDPDVVLVDQVRPNWQDMLITPANRRRFSGSLSGNGTTRRIIVRPHPTTGSTSRRASARSYSSLGASYYSSHFNSMRNIDVDPEEAMVMEAIRQSLQDQQQHQQPQQQQQSSSMTNQHIA
ncbi:SNF1-interacting protein [Apophysomyces ossiformis]|uniref:SNF1-interacting protein n=1 Tax=Apophysomyces ossiformis TaxID=679940 RepID=A0A8H7BZH5_9FUNG|nr:SNF1-interacting protein [Apophysomyces ossiformis]